MTDSELAYPFLICAPRGAQIGEPGTLRLRVAKSIQAGSTECLG
jgi:hypothetical protein